MDHNQRRRLNLSPETTARTLLAIREQKCPQKRGPNCLSILEAIKFVKGTLPRKEHQRIDAHVLYCLGCSLRIESLRATALSEAHPH